VNIVIPVKGCNTKLKKIAYCADGMKFCLVMEEGAERGKYLTINIKKKLNLIANFKRRIQNNQV